jgi:hypothetical protein
MKCASPATRLALAWATASAKRVAEKRESLSLVERETCNESPILTNADLA